MDGSGANPLQASLDPATFGSWIGIQTVAGQAALAEKTATWTQDPAILRARSHEFAVLQQTLRDSPGLSLALQHRFATLGRLESDLQSLCEPASELEQEGYKELLFLPDWAKPLNFIPYLLVLWAVLRIYIFPGISLLMPVAMLLAPFFLLRFLFGIPITSNRYLNILQGLFSGNIGAALQPGAAASAAASSPFSSFLQGFDIGQLTKIGFLGVTVVQSFLQPYWTYKHLSSIDSILGAKAKTLETFQTLYEEIRGTLEEAGYTFSPNPFRPPSQEPRVGVAFAHMSPAYLQLAVKRLGALEALVCLANRQDICPVVWQTKATGENGKGDSASAVKLVLRNTYDYRVPITSRRTFNIQLQEGHTDNAQAHALLTGPNRGGKSTTLRALVSSVVLAHTYGCATATAAEMSVFDAIRICLTPEDLPGSKSRFEREIEFTASTLQDDTGSSLVLIDELFHSTNPPDAERACRIYTERLWRKPNTLSVISTHLFDFVKDAPEGIQRLCCPATERSDGSIDYTYQLSPGVCTVSSVNELLIEHFAPL
jgi:hypothetical protein